MPSPSDSLGTAPVTLLTVEHAGRTWRLSSKPIEVDDDGTSRLYRGGLAPLDVYASGPLSGVAEVQSQAFEAITDSDLASLSGEHHLTSEATAEIAIVEPSLDPTKLPSFDERRVMLSGSIEVQSDGYEGRPIRLTVTADDPAEQPGTWPAPEHVVNADTWTTAGVRGFDTETEGRSYPSVFGRAGLIWAGAANANVAALPLLPVDIISTSAHIERTPFGLITDWHPAPVTGIHGIVSYGWVYPGTGASKGLCTITRDDGTTAIGEIYYATDALGEIVSIVKTQAGEPFNITYLATSNNTYFVTFNNNNGGIANSTYLDGLRGAGEIIRWALERSEVTVDWRRSSSALAVLDRYELAGFWDQPVEPWSWLVDNVFPLLPASWVAGPQGVYPVVWRLDAIHETSDARLTDGLDCTIDGPISYDGDPLSRHTLDYANGLVAGVWRRRAVHHGQDTRDTTRESMSIHLRRSQLRYGSRRGSVWLAREQATESDLIYADRTADRVLGWWSRVNSQPAMTLRVVSDGLHHRTRVAALEPGMAVSLTSSRYSLTNRVAYVRRAGWLGGVCYTDLVILSAP